MLSWNILIPMIQQPQTESVYAYRSAQINHTNLMPPTCPLNQNSLTLQRSRMDVKIKRALKKFRRLINRYFSLCVTAYFLISHSLWLCFSLLWADVEYKGRHCHSRSICRADKYHSAEVQTHGRGVTPSGWFVKHKRHWKLFNLIRKDRPDILCIESLIIDKVMYLVVPVMDIRGTWCGWELFLFYFDELRWKDCAHRNFCSPFLQVHHK